MGKQNGGRQDIELMAHLMRRAGFGATQGEIEERVERGYEATLEDLLDTGNAQWIGEFVVRRFDPRSIRDDQLSRIGAAMAVPHGHIRRAAAGKGDALLARHFRHRFPESNQRQGAIRPSGQCSGATGWAGSTGSCWSLRRTRR